MNGRERERERVIHRVPEVGVVGISHHTAPLEVRERCVIEGEELARVAEALRGEGARAVVVLSTCNRTELYVEAGDSGALARAEALLRGRAGLDASAHEGTIYTEENAAAARHLFRVAAGLDSLVLGEAQIQGQVRSAYETATRMGGTGPLLARLFETALSVGGRVRSETKVGAGAASVPSAAVEVARKIFGALEGRSVVVVGAGEMSELALQCLTDAGVSDAVVANRSGEKAEALATRLGARAVPFDAMPALLTDADIVVSATAAPHVVLTEAMVRSAFRDGRRKPMLILDIALPRDVEASVAAIDGVFLYTIDDLKTVVESTLEARRDEIALAEHIVDAGVREYGTWHAGRSVVPVIQALRGRAEELRRAEVERTLASLQLDPAQAEAVEALTRQLLAKMLHAPTTRLREAAASGRESEVADIARFLFDLQDEPPENGSR